MARESFADPGVAAQLNRDFVAIKVDREERPDIDHLYMTACQALTGRGGWPLSVFLTPAGEPFFAGTYFPRQRRLGMPGFVDVLTYIARLWRDERQKPLATARELTRLLQDPVKRTAGAGAPDYYQLLSLARENLGRAFDRQYGGFGFAPKFPTPHNLLFLLRWHRRTGDLQALEMVEKTLRGMRRGGLFDQLGYGFHRYSVDEQWLVPHFEKMLYDQAMLMLAYTEAWQATGWDEYAKVVGEVAAYLEEEMRVPAGGFCAAEDADSEGEEGRYYLWTPAAVAAHLDAETAALVCRYYNISADGDLPGGSVPHLDAGLEEVAAEFSLAPAAAAARLTAAVEKLRAGRRQRVRPFKDRKIIVSWNGLAIAALARAGRALDRRSWRELAAAAATRLLTTGHRPDGGLRRCLAGGTAELPGFLDDYAFLVWGLLELYQADGDPAWLQAAGELNDKMIALFRDGEHGRFFFTGADGEPLIARPVDQVDGAIPAGSSVAAANLLCLGRLLARPELEEMGRELIDYTLGIAGRNPEIFTHLLVAVDFLLGPVRELVIAGEAAANATRAMRRLAGRLFLPRTLTVFRPAGERGAALTALIPALKSLPAAVDGRPCACLCRQYRCQAVIDDPEELAAALQA